jgi:hypothetical protein
MEDYNKTPNTSEKHQTVGVEKPYLKGLRPTFVKLLSTQHKITSALRLNHSTCSEPHLRHQIHLLIWSTGPIRTFQRSKFGS